MHSLNRFKPSLLNDLINESFYDEFENDILWYIFGRLPSKDRLLCCFELAIRKPYKRTLRRAFDELIRKKDSYDDLGNILLQPIITCIENDSLFEFLGPKYLANLINATQYCSILVNNTEIIPVRLQRILSIIEYIDDENTRKLNLIHLSRYVTTNSESMSYWLSWLKANNDSEEDLFSYGLIYWTKYADPQVLNQWKDHFLPTTSADLSTILKRGNRELLALIDELIAPISRLDFKELFERACNHGSIEVFEGLLVKMKPGDISENIDSYLDYAKNNKEIYERLLAMK